MQKHTATRRLKAILIVGIAIVVTTLLLGCGADKQAEEARLNYVMGCESLDQGDYELATSYFEKVDANSDLYQQAQNKIAIAEENLQKQLEQSAINYGKGLERFNNGQYQLALDCFKRVSERDTERYSKAEDYIRRCNEQLEFRKTQATVVGTTKPTTEPSSSDSSYETLAKLALEDGYTWVELNSREKTELIAFMKKVMATTSTPMTHSVNWYVEMLDAFYQSSDHYIMSQPIIDVIGAGELLYELY